MTFVIIALAAVSLLLIYLEFFLPGSILAIGGGILFFLSLALFLMQSPSLLSVILCLLGFFSLLALVCKIALIQLKKGEEKGFYLARTQEGHSASSFDLSLIGKTGIAFSNLRPSGYVLIENQRIQAISSSGFIVQGSEVIVTSGEGAHLIVTHYHGDTKKS